MNLAQFESYSIVFMSILLLWALSWIVLSAVKMRDSRHKIFWQVNLFWNVVNLVIASVTLLQISTRQVLLFEEAQRLITIVGVNIILDIGYLIVALLLLQRRSDVKNQIGTAIIVQGSFLLILDSAIVLVLKPFL